VSGRVGISLVGLLTYLWSAGQCKDEVLGQRVYVNYVDGGIVDKDTLAFLTEHLLCHQHWLLVIHQLKANIN